MMHRTRWRTKKINLNHRLKGWPVGALPKIVDGTNDDWIATGLKMPLDLMTMLIPTNCDTNCYSAKVANYNLLDFVNPNCIIWKQLMIYENISKKATKKIKRFLNKI